MAQQTISGGLDLITATIVPREITFYFVTEENLNNIKEKSLLADVLMLLTSILLAAFFSTVITMGAIGASTDAGVMSTLTTYKWVLLSLGGIFLLLTIYFLCTARKAIKRITQSEVKLG